MSDKDIEKKADEFTKFVAEQINPMVKKTAADLALVSMRAVLKFGLQPDMKAQRELLNRVTKAYIDTLNNFVGRIGDETDNHFGVGKEK